MKDNLLVNPVISVATASGTTRRSLPGVLEALGRDDVAGFPGIRPHQRHPWHAFLCQLAVMAVEEAGGDAAFTDIAEDAWREMLRALTPGHADDAPWRLAVADLSKPAFLQPPVPEGTLADFTGMADSDPFSPFSLDVIVSSKQHGEKSKASGEADAEQWLIGLVLLQTFSGHFGKPNYGVARQNGGFAARHGVSLSFSLRPGIDWARDCRVILASLEAIRDQGLFHPEMGRRLLWLMPWAGEKNASLPVADLHPLFIEVCRRIRLQRDPQGVVRFFAKGTKAARVDAKEYSGALADPWMPLKKEGREGYKAYNQEPHYTVAHEVIFDRTAFEPSLLQNRHPGDPKKDMAMCFRMFRRTQGGSDGYHERRIPVPPQCVPFLDDQVFEAATVAKDMAKAAKDAKNRALRPAVLQLMQAANEGPEFKQPETSEWASRFAQAFDDRVDEAFFPTLWAILESRGEREYALASLKPWYEFLVGAAREVFASARDAAPMSSSLGYRAAAKAENLLEGSLNKHLSIREES